MKSKIIPLKGNRQEQFIRIIAGQFGVYSDNELKLIKVLCQYEMFQAFFLDKYTRIKLIKAMDCPPSTFSTCLARLVKANVIARVGKTLYFNVSFKDLGELDQVIFRYSSSSDLVE